jgi:NCS1 family nucleobase:cation symporter-1
MHSLEPFLLMLSSVFVPLYGVILARLAGTPQIASLVAGRKVNTSAVAIWLLGIACYHLCAKFAPDWGAALPTLALTFVLARLTRANPGGITAAA